MNTHFALRILLCMAVLTAVSGFKFRCWWFCTDQTAVQGDYIESRNKCRELAELKVDMGSRNANGGPAAQASDDKARKSQLVSLFSDCMGQNGWTVPDGKGGEKAAASSVSAPPPAASPSGAPAAVVPATAAAATTNKAALSRTAECAFARSNAKVSSISASRAKACDLECAQRLKAAPEAPRPSACPAERNSAITRPGIE